MKKKGSDHNVISRYYQQVISGWGDSSQSENKSNDSVEVFTLTEEQSNDFWQQGEHILLIPIKLKQISVLDNKYTYSVQIPTDLNVSVQSVIKRGKEAPKLSVNIPAATRQDKAKISVVYGISGTGSGSFPCLVKPTLPANIAYITSRILGIVHRAIELRIQHIDRAPSETRGIDARRSENATSARKDLGKHQETGRGDTLRPEILPENATETTTEMDEAHGQVLGVRPRNRKNRLDTI